MLQAMTNEPPQIAVLGMKIEDGAIRERVREIIFRLVGEGEPLP